MYRLTTPSLKTSEEVEEMSRAGRRMKDFWYWVPSLLQAGSRDETLDLMIREWWGCPLWLSLSINEVVAHGKPEGRQLSTGDLITVDVAVQQQGWWLDSARTFGVGQISAEKKSLLEGGRALWIKAASTVRPGMAYDELAEECQSFANDRGLILWRDGLSHGIGRRLHEAPRISLAGKQPDGGWFVPGMTFALEPVVLSEKCDVFSDERGIYRMAGEEGRDGRRVSVHFEDTLALFSWGIKSITSGFFMKIS